MSEEAGTVMDKEMRNQIRKMVEEARRLLEEDISQQLEGIYGITPKKIQAEESMPIFKQYPHRLSERRDIIAAVEYEETSGLKRFEAVEKFSRETVFTYLNRLAALRMMEARKLISESIAKDSESAGFKLFKRVCPEVCRSHNDDGYRLYLEMLFDEVAANIPDLFDRSLPYSIIFPTAGVLKKVLNLLNQPSLSAIWQEDETIGWIYQYFTPKELREKLRKESQTPRSSYELALRNQFYTPAYVVRFLTDNTLGRLWYEMNPGTSLLESCAYLVRRPGEVLPERKKVAPTDIKVLDPACGSGHYLLYAFDVLARIYEEEGYDRSRIPGQILKYNLYGIDIDPRAVQIAALALNLKARRYDQNALVGRAHVACAGPMPGEKEMFKEFLGKLQSPTLQRIAGKMWDSLSLAGDAGSLLKAEKELKEIIRNERERCDSQPEPVLFQEFTSPGQLRPDFSDVDEDFWQQAEHRILRLLWDYSSEVTNGKTVKRRLFGHDARQGVEFINILRQKFDVVLMNPPFGEGARISKAYIEKRYPNTKNDVYAAFVERGLELMKPEGFLGAITSRTGFFLTTFSRWREEILLPMTSILAVADLGFGVLDNAMVETAAYVLAKPKRQGQLSTFFRLLKAVDKAGWISACVEAIAGGDEHEAVHLVDQDTFRMIPGSPFPYWVSDDMRRKFVELPPFEGNGGEVRQGLATADDFRFVRAAWEVPPYKIGQGKKWVPFAKGGEYSPYYDDIHLLVNWENDGAEIRNYKDENGRLLSRPQNIECYFRSGLTYPRVTFNFSMRIMPSGCIFADKGPAVFSSKDKLLYLLAFFNSRLFFFLLEQICEIRRWEVGRVQIVPYLLPGDNVYCNINEFAKNIVEIKRQKFSFTETSRTFISPVLLVSKGKTLLYIFLKQLEINDDLMVRYLEFDWQVNVNILDAYKVCDYDKKVMRSELGMHPCTYDQIGIDKSMLSRAYLSKNVFLNSETEENVQQNENKGVLVEKERTRLSFRSIIDLAHLFKTHPRVIVEKRQELGLYRPEELAEETANLLMYTVGCAFGRWDIRIGKSPSLAPPLPEPFEPLPVCSPGMLIGIGGLPATETPENYPVNIRWDGVLVDDEGHPSDVVASVREVLGYLFGDGDPTAIEREACEILGVKDLRIWFVNKFFLFHIKRYSKSRRKAPIYWQLRSPRKNYSVFLYYHRITKDTLFHVIRSYVDPKIQYERGKLDEFKGLLESAKGQGRQERVYAGMVEDKERFLEELTQFRENIFEVAGMGYAPDLDDGVLINIAPLHKVVPWNDAEKTWKELVEGKYEWSTMAKNLMLQSLSR